MLLLAQGKGKEDAGWGVSAMPKSEWAEAVARVNARVARSLQIQMEQPLANQPLRQVPEPAKQVAAKP